MPIICPILTFAQFLVQSDEPIDCMGEDCAWFGRGCPAFPTPAMRNEFSPKIKALKEEKLKNARI